MKRCLICLCPTTRRRRSSDPGGLIVPDSEGHLTKDEDKKKTNLSLSLLEEEVDSFYFIHKFLGLSTEVCAGLLETHGSPSSWFSLCADCHSAFLLEGKELFHQIQELQKCHGDLGQRALGRMRVKVETLLEEDGLAPKDHEEEEEMAVFLGSHKMNVFVIDPTTVDETMSTIIRSYLLTSDLPSTSSDSSGHFSKDDGPIVEDIEDDDDDDDYVPLPPPPRRRGRPRGKTIGQMKEHLPTETSCRRSKRKSVVAPSKSNPPPADNNNGNTLEAVRVKNKQRKLKKAKEVQKEGPPDEDVFEPRAKKKRSKVRKHRHWEGKQKKAGKCYECRSRSLPPGEGLEDHIRRVHTLPEVLACGGCGQVILKVQEYLDHVSKSQLDDPSSPCVTCVMSCPHPACISQDDPTLFRGSEGALAVHLKSAHYLPEDNLEGKVYKCHLCGAEYGVKSYRERHVQLDHIEPLIQCDRPNCTTVVRGRKRMNFHVARVHLVLEKVLPVEICPECGKQFKDAWHLRRHRKLHSTETPFLCQECGKGYKVLDQLKTHMWTHDKELYKEKYGKYKENAKKRKTEEDKGVPPSGGRRLKLNRTGDKVDGEDGQRENLSKD